MSILWLVITDVEVAVTSDATGELHVLLHDSLSLGVDGTQVGLFEDSDDVGLSGFLEGNESVRLESELVVHI